MGRPKLALPLSDRTVLEHVVAAVHNGGVPDVVVVIGPGTSFLQPLAERACARVYLLPEDTPDMRATVQAGLAWLEQQFQPTEDDAWLLTSIGIAGYRLLLSTCPPTTARGLPEIATRGGPATIAPRSGVR